MFSPPNYRCGVGKSFVVLKKTTTTFYIIKYSIHLLICNLAWVTPTLLLFPLEKRKMLFSGKNKYRANLVDTYSSLMAL